jgi:hypothetical protein
MMVLLLGRGLITIGSITWVKSSFRSVKALGYLLWELVLNFIFSQCMDEFTEFFIVNESQLEH